MPEIQYPTNPNSDTAFVVRDDGKKNRALMVAPQDTSTLELSDNPNSTKGYVTVDGKKHRVNLVVDLGGGGGGGTVDYSKTVQKTATMPAADASNAGQVYMYTGATNANFTQNYIYKNVKTATYTGTVSFEPATLSGTTVTCSGDNFANFLTESGVEPLSVVSGTMTYDVASSLWVLVGKDSDGNTVLTFQEYQQDFVDAGFTFTGTPQDGDVVAFTCTVEEASATYAWTRVDVQPAGATYTAGNSIDITNGVISTKVPLAQSPADTAVASIRDQTEEGGVMAIGAGAYAANHNTLGGNSVAVGPYANAGMMAAAFGASTTASTSATAIGNYANASGSGVAVGVNTKAGNGAIVIGSNNADTDDRSPAGTMCVYLKKSSESEAVRYTLLEPGAFIPTARLTKVNTTATLAAADWSSNTQTVSVTGMTADGVVFVNPTPANQSAYTDAGILCTAQAAGSLTFTCDTVPSADIVVTVVML